MQSTITRMYDAMLSPEQQQNLEDRQRTMAAEAVVQALEWQINAPVAGHAVQLEFS
jgi:hypothetical protein